MKGITRSKIWILCGMMGALLMTVPYAEASSNSDRDGDDDSCTCRGYSRGDDDSCRGDSRGDDDSCRGDSRGRVRGEVKYEFETGLIQCDDVLPPSSCGTDPLIGGKVKIEKGGGVEVYVAGAFPLTTYDVVYVSLDGSTLPIGPITTDSRGNARMTWWRVFALGSTDAGNLRLERGGVTQFVSGFTAIR